MTTHTIRKGFDIRIAGAAPTNLQAAAEPVLVGISPREFLGVKPKLTVKEGDQVKTGQSLFFDKNRPAVHFVATATGKVTKIQLGHKRFPERIEITPGAGDQFAEAPRVNGALSSVARDELIAALQGSGLWPLLRQRPLGKIADPERTPSAIYVNGMDTEPLAADPAFATRNLGDELQAGIDAMKRLTDGPVHLTVRAGGANDVFAKLKGVETHQFAGPHPAGLVGTHISRIAPLHADQVVWYLKAQEVAAIGHWVHTGHFPTHKVIAVAGSSAPQRGYFKVRAGASLLTVTGGQPLGDDVRLINGTVLSGTAVAGTDPLGYYAQTVTAIPEGAGVRDLFGWATPQFGKHSASRAVFGWLFRKQEYELDARLNGGQRNMVNIGAWERMMALDIHPTYLARAIQAGDLEEALSLGLLEVTEEDVALCTYADPCKIEVGDIVRQGLELYEKEG